MKHISSLITLSLTICLNSFSQIGSTESFDGTTFVPTGWTNLLVSGTNTWTRVTTGAFPTQATHSGAGEAQFNSYSVSGGVRALVSPVINFAARGTATTSISFWMYRDNGYNTTADKIDIYMNTSANLTGASLLGTVNRAIGLTPIVSANGWYQYTFTVPATYTTATNYFVIKGTSAYGNNIFIDDVSWTSFPSAYIDMMASALISPSGNFNCFGSNQSVSIQIKNNGSAPINFATNPVTLNSNVVIVPSITTAPINSVVIAPSILNNGTLAVGATTNVVVTNSLNMIVNGTYSFNASTSVVGDALTTNDAMATSVIIVSKVYTFPYITDFSSLPIPSFLSQQVSGTGLWSVITTGNLTNPTLAPVLNSNNGFAYFNSYSYSSGTISNLITPNFDMTTLTSPAIDLWVSQDVGWSTSNDKLDVIISTDGGNTWSASLQSIPRYNTAYSTPGWKLFTVPLTAYAGLSCVRIAIKATSDYGNNMAIDYLKVYDRGSLLPIQLISFSGEKMSDNENVLTWQTAVEINTKSFIIEASSDGINFTTQHIETAAGKQTGKTYHYIDTLEKEMPIMYYRLVSIDIDNSRETYNIVSIERTYKKSFAAILFPNPSIGNTTLQINLEEDDEILIELFDLKGDVIFKELKALNSGKNLIAILSEELDKGIYLVNITSQKNKSDLKQIKLAKN